MMLDLCMHLFELINNSIHADAKHIYINYIEQQNLIHFTVKDDGKGIEKEKLTDVTSPFMTQRKTRNVGMGLAFMKQLVDMTGGKMHIESVIHEGTTVYVELPRYHIDVCERGDFGELMMLCIQANPEIEYCLNIQIDSLKFTFDTTWLKAEIQPLSIDEATILIWIKEYINNNINTKENKNEKFRRITENS